MDQVLTVDEVAKLLRLSHSTVYKRIKLGGIPAVKMGRHWRFKREAIEKLMSKPKAAR